MERQEIGLMAGPAGREGPAPDPFERPPRRAGIPGPQAKDPSPQLDEKNAAGAQEALPHPAPGRGAAHAISRSHSACPLPPAEPSLPRG